MTVSLMTDPELPVRVQAGSCLRDLLRKKQCQGVVLPLLEMMVTQLFSLMSEIDNDSVIETLEIIIEKFGDNLAVDCDYFCCCHFCYYCLVVVIVIVYSNFFTKKNTPFVF